MLNEYEILLQQKTLYKNKIRETKESLHDYESKLKSINISMYELENKKQGELLFS